MDIVVRKYGGSSVSSVAKIMDIALSTKNWLETNPNKKLLIVVSAMGETTSHFTEMALQISPKPKARELDMLLTAGERISMSLLAIALEALGQKAISLTGSQAGINSENRFNSSRIVRIQADRVIKNLDTNHIVVVAGFQGVSPTRDVTTLGKGGSDTTAVALACAIGAEVCEICTDVKGVMDSDPRLTGSEKVLKTLDYQTLLDMANFGAKVIHPRAVELARKFNIKLVIRNSLNDSIRTLVSERKVDMERSHMERSRIESVNCRNNIVRFIGKTKNWKHLLSEISKSRITVQNPVIHHTKTETKYFFWTNIEEWQPDFIPDLEYSLDFGIVAVTGFELSSDIQILEQLQELISKKSKIDYIISTGSSFVFFLPKKDVQEVNKAIYNRFLKGKK